jgi:hypothetical protein
MNSAYTTNWTTRKLDFTGTTTEHTWKNQSTNQSTNILFTAVGISFKYSSTQISVYTEETEKCWLNFKQISHHKIRGSHIDADKH